MCDDPTTMAHHTSLMQSIRPVTADPHADPGPAKGGSSGSPGPTATYEGGSSRSRGPPGEPAKGRTPGSAGIRTLTWDMSSFLEQCVALYQELGGVAAKKLKRVDTPFMEIPPQEIIEDAESKGTGELQNAACRILMKLLYAARMARFDLLRAIGFLATRITKWSPLCDKMLHRLMCYVNATINLKMGAWVGDTIGELTLTLFTDADFAGDIVSRRSTTGVFLCLQGPRTFVPLAAISKRQTCVSHSTPEARLSRLTMACALRVSPLSIYGRPSSADQ